MKILFLCGGAREKTLRYLLEHGENVVALVTPRLTRHNTRFTDVITTAVEFGVPVFPVNRSDSLFDLPIPRFDTIVSCGFPYLIKKDFIQYSDYAINVHPTLLPKYRGYRSGPYVIMNGECESGVTIHFMTEEFDKGDIILQSGFPVTPFDTTVSLQRKCQEIEPKLLYDALQMIKTEEFETTKQNEDFASTYTHMRTPEDSKLDCNKSLKELYNEIRACDPDDYPAYFFVEGEKVCIKLWRPYKPEGEEDTI